MEIRIILRGVLSGFVAGVLGSLFAAVFAEPFIQQGIDYESGRDDVLNQLNQAAGRPVGAEGPELVSRTVQSSVGLATGIIGFSVAMGALVAVAYVVLHGRFQVRPRNLAWLVAAFGFLGVFLLPFVKYPTNPPAVGNADTIAARGQLYLLMVGFSLILLSLAVYAARRLRARVGPVTATVAAAVGFLVVFGVLVGVLPSLGNLSADVARTGEFGYARAATETPAPITNILSTPLTIDGRTIAPGQLVYPGFDADVLWKFRWYSILGQALIWVTIALAFGALLERFLLAPSATTTATAAADAAPEPIAVR